MSFYSREYKPFSFLWLIQRFMVVIRERRMPDTRLIRLKLKRVFIPGSELHKSRKSPFGLKESEEHMLSEKAGDFSRIRINRPVPHSPELINQFFDQVYVLNHRDRSAQRLNIISQLRSLNIQAEVVECPGNLVIPDGQTLDLYDDKAVGMLKAFETALEDAREKNFLRILILQDSAQFCLNFHDRFRQAISVLPENWDLLWMNGTKAGNTRKALRDAPQNIPLSFAFGLHARLFGPAAMMARGRKASLSTILSALGEQSKDALFMVTPALFLPSLAEKYDNDPEANKFFRDLGIDPAAFDLTRHREMVSVIMPAYNAEKTIERSIRSVLQQSYKNLEIIVSDDGSRDRTREIVKELGREDPRVILVDNKVNRGCYFARNAAVRRSAGSYIAVQDADDLSFPKRLEKQMIPLVAGNAEFTLTWILRSRLKISEFDGLSEREMLLKALNNRKLQPNNRYGYWDRPILGFMTSMFVRSLFEELGLFWEHRFGADAEYFERILFSRTGLIMPPGPKNVHSYLREHGTIPGIYQRIEEILLISAEMNDANITNSYSKDDLAAFIADYRKKYTGGSEYEYPRL